MQLRVRSEWTRYVFDHFQPNLQTPINRFIFIAGNLKRIDLFHQIRIGVDDLFDVRWIYLCSVKWHSQITATIHKQNRKVALRFRQYGNSDTFRLQLLSELRVRNDTAKIVQVIAELRSCAGLSSDSKN